MNYVISNAGSNEVTIFAITDEKLYVPVVTLSTEDSARLLEQLKSGFKRTINWNKYHSKTRTLNASNPYLDYLIGINFQGVIRLFVLTFNFNENRKGHSRFYLPNEKVKD